MQNYSAVSRHAQGPRRQKATPTHARAPNGAASSQLVDVGGGILWAEAHGKPSVELIQCRIAATSANPLLLVCRVLVRISAVSLAAAPAMLFLCVAKSASLHGVAEALIADRVG